MDETLALQVEHLSLGLMHNKGCLNILDDLNLNLKPGQTIGLVGESGSGKSFTALSILRLLPLHAVYGEQAKIRIHDVDLLQLEQYRMRELRGKKVSMIFQEPMLALNPLRTMYQHLCDVILAHQTLSRQALDAHIMQLMEDTELADMKWHLQEYPHQWSGGQKQRFLIAMALANQPEIILADEPTTALDLVIQAQILSLLKKIQVKHQLAMIIISHDFSVIRYLADEVFVMYAGQFIEHASAYDFWQEAKHPYVHQLMSSLPHFSKRGQSLAVIAGQVPHFQHLPSGCRFHPRCAFAMNICKTKSPTWFEAKTQHQVRCHLYPSEDVVKLNGPVLTLKTQAQAQAEPKTILVVENLGVEQLNVKRSKTHILQGVNFEVIQGRILAVVGESGSGKSTLAATLVGLQSYQAGKITYAQHLKPQDIQMVFQDPSSALNPRWLINDILREALKARPQDKIKSILDAVQMPHSCLHVYPHELSGGQRQRIAIARALLAEPKLLICDEPTSALDISVQAQILNLLKSLQLEFGFTCVLITHDLDVVAYLADDILILKDGQVVEYGNFLDIWQSPKAQYTHLLFSAAAT